MKGLRNKRSEDNQRKRPMSRISPTFVWVISNRSFRTVAILAPLESYERAVP